MPLPSFQIQTPSLAFQTETPGSLALVDLQTGRRILHIPTADLFVPVIDGQRANLTFSHEQVISATRVDLYFTGAQFESFCLRIEGRPGDDAMAISCAFKLNSGGQLNQIDFFPHETVLDFYHIVNYRNRHGTEATLPELLPATSEGCKTDTLLHRLAVRAASHSPFFSQARASALLRRLRLAARLRHVSSKRPTEGALTGISTMAQRRMANRWLPARNSSRPLPPLYPPRPTVEEMLDVYARMLIDAGKIPNPAKKVRHAWWREPLYCTWIDQCSAASQAVVPVDLKEQAEQAAGPAVPPVTRSENPCPPCRRSHRA